MIINDLFNNKKTAVAEGSKMARADKSAKTPKPKDQQEYDDVEKYRKDLAQSYNKEPNFGIKDDEEENKWWIDYDLDEGSFDHWSPMGKDSIHQDRIRSLQNLIAIAKEQDRPLRVQELELALKKLQGMAEAFANPGSGSTGTSRGAKRIANTVRKALAKNSETPDQIAARKDFEAQTDARMRQKKKEQGMAEGKKPDNYHIVNKDGKPATLASYADRASAEKDRDAKHPGAEVRQLGPRGKVKNVSEVSLGDYRKKAAVSQAGAKIDRFFGRDDAAKVAAADQTIAKRERGLARADARRKPYTPPAAAPADLEKQQRDLTAKYPNIDELVRRAELNRDPDYEMADGQAYYAARDAEQNYQKLRQIQRVIQGLNESLQRTQP
jgi:hypothetical protein